MHSARSCASSGSHHGKPNNASEFTGRSFTPSVNSLMHHQCHSPSSRTARTIRRLAVPILLLWVGVAALTNIVAPQLEVVGAARSVSLNAADSPSIQAMRHIGEKFNEFDSDSAAMIVLEGDHPLGADAHHFYDSLVQRLAQDPGLCDAQLQG